MLVSGIVVSIVALMKLINNAKGHKKHLANVGKLLSLVHDTLAPFQSVEAQGNVPAAFTVSACSAVGT